MDLEFYKSIIRSAPFGYAYHKMITNRDGLALDYLFVEVNDYFASLFSIPASQIEGKTAMELIPGIKNDRFNWISFYAEISKTGGSEIFEQYSMDLGRWFKIYAYSKEPGYFTTIFLDITADKKFEISLSNSEAKYRQMVESSPDVIWTMDLSGKYIYVSPSVYNLRGYTAKENMEQTLDETLTPSSVETAKILFKEVARLIATGKEEGPRRVVLEQYCKDRTTVLTEIHITLVYDSCGNFKNILGVTRKLEK